MDKINKLLIIGCLAFITISQAQTVEIDGVVVGNSDVENIHVINKTLNTYTTTNKLGGFTIQVRVLDTLVFSSVQYKLKAVQIKPEHISDKNIRIVLEENVNQLDQVVVGKILTGDLSSDVKNSDAERPIDFYDVGIPGYTGKRKTQNERRLHEADAGKFVSLGLGVSVNLNKVLNAITGRTKRLKGRVRVESNNVLLNKIKADLPDNFFIIYPLEEQFRADFFYFCTDDPNFEKRCKNKSSIEIFEFMTEKIKAYKSNLKSAND